MHKPTEHKILYRTAHPIRIGPLLLGESRRMKTLTRLFGSAC